MVTGTGRVRTGDLGIGDTTYCHSLYCSVLWIHPNHQSNISPVTPGMYVEAATWHIPSALNAHPASKGR